MIKSYNDLTVILTLYKTPKNNLQYLTNYKKFKTLVFDQEGKIENEKILRKKFGKKLKYFSSKKNIGLSKASNFLLSKVETKFFLFTQPDVLITESSINELYKIICKNNKLIILSPNHQKKINDDTNEYSYKKKINYSCILCDTMKINNIGFFDEDFFLYWEDIHLEEKINNSIYKMAIANNVEVKHFSSQSSKKNYLTNYIRKKNYLYGEFVFDYKKKRLRYLKITRKIIQNIILFFFHLFIFRFNNSLENIANLNGITKFIIYILNKKKK